MCLARCIGSVGRWIDHPSTWWKKSCCTRVVPKALRTSTSSVLYTSSGIYTGMYVRIGLRGARGEPRLSDGALVSRVGRVLLLRTSTSQVLYTSSGICS
jgi:hypothetical protein